MTESVTAYNAAKAVNNVLTQAGIVDTNIKSKRYGLIKQLPPQMFYNYTTARINKDEKPLIECDENGRILVSALTEWTKRYLQKQVDKTEENVPVLDVFEAVESE